MDKIIYYQQCIKRILSTYKAINNRYPTIQTHILIDDEQGHYYIMRVGWDLNNNRVHYCVLHFDIIDHKIWIQRNQTDWDLGVDFEEMDVPKSDIVIGFLSPEQRAMSKYAIN